MMKLSDTLKSELINDLYEEDMEIWILHCNPLNFRVAPPSSLSQLVSKQSNHLRSLRLNYRITMLDSCKFINLRELLLCNASFPHYPSELTNMPCLATLVFGLVDGIPEELYRQLTCSRTLPNLKNIEYAQVGLLYTVNNYRCKCSEPCIYNLPWAGSVRLIDSSDVTGFFLSCLGINKEHHNGIINTVNNLPYVGYGNEYRCDIKGNFNMIGQLCVQIRLFRVLLPYLPTTHAKQVKLRDYYIITDAGVNTVRDLLANVVADELLISKHDELTTTKVANMLVNVDTVPNVVIDQCPNVNVAELRTLYLAITFNVGETP